MPRRFAFCLLLTLAAACARAQDPNLWVFLCFGQSNMEGSADIEADDQGPVDERFQMLAAVDFPQRGREQGNWYPATPPLCRPWTRLSPADYFGRTLVERLPQEVRVGVVHVAVGGCDIKLFDKDRYEEYAKTAPDWMVDKIEAYGGSPYHRLVEMAKTAQQSGVIRGMLLHQGETNTGDTEWPKNVKRVYDYLLADLGLDARDVPLLAGEVVAEEQGGRCASMNPIIRTLPDVIPTAQVVPSAGCDVQEDLIHFSSAGCRELGKRYADTMLPLLAHATGQVE